MDYYPWVDKLIAATCERLECTELLNRIFVVNNYRIVGAYGRARIIGNNYEIELCRKQLDACTQTQQMQTVIHEVCHVVDHYKYKNWGHGPTWKALMLHCNQSPDRCSNHNAIVKGAMGHCPVCGPIYVGPTRYKRIKLGTHRYRCNKCRNNIEPVKE